MPKAEIAKLAWEAFDKETWALHLHARNAKTGHGRVLVLEGALRAIVERRLAARRLDSRLIFHREGQPVREFREAWSSACRRAGILFHDLRRSAIRNMVRAGVDPAVVMRISGHRTRDTFDRYNITSEDDLRDAMKRTEDYISALPRKRKTSPLRKTAG